MAHVWHYSLPPQGHLHLDRSGSIPEWVTRLSSLTAEAVEAAQAELRKMRELESLVARL